MNAVASDPLSFARNLITLLDQGSFTSTYKYALLVALIELCQEKAPESSGNDELPTLDTHAITERMVQLYWPQATAAHELTAGRLTQIGGGNEISFFREFDELPEAESGLPLARAKRLDPDGYDRAVRRLERTVITEPLPKLQRLARGPGELAFLYDFPDRERRNRIRFRGGVVENLVGLSDLLRPLIEHRWAQKVAQLNGLPYRALEESLFGSERISLDPVRADLLALHERRCFYCSASIAKGEIDHFIPWVRHHDNRIENLVPACSRCNNAKRDTPASVPHLEKWLSRFAHPMARSLQEAADRRGWETNPEAVLAVAQTLYANLAAETELWEEPGKLVQPGQDKLASLING